MTLFPAGCIFITLSLLSSIQGSAIVSRELCGGSMHVVDSVVIDIPLQENWAWEIQTDKDHILVFDLVHQDWNFEQAKEFLAIHDGLGKDSPVLRQENQKHHEVGLTANNKLNRYLYSTSSVAQVRFKNAPKSSLKLRIQKAADCPFSIGVESQCGRVVDETSCYCATFTKRNQPSQTSFCSSNQMKLLSVETYAEEQAIYAAWGASVNFWTSGSDVYSEGTWVWESTGARIYPGYANWATYEPNNNENSEDCLMILNGWYDYTCASTFDAICEVHPPNNTNVSTTQPTVTTTLKAPTTE
ncbi:hypothetical protein DAPPUDRAFT_225009 [Daphnia pulex]|uniref:C-type lectin domain-containing protein n=1 Tax=Daphnia pulex TaxID=6669 RepID=E9GLF4_DAPPU|nr:hypothetical protein DAPPUDRAFT_225009 [Daphnia pulex]|eukprot:EFX79505.1 hypothetical protein DAPPUDRAFT_225009 [Daphnia pulex]